MQGDVLDYDEVVAQFDRTMDWLAGVYVDALNVIHYMHDKYAYERIEMALHDYAPLHLATGIAGLSVAADSLSAIKLRAGEGAARRDRAGRGLRHRGRLPGFGNNDDRADEIAVVARSSTFMTKLRKYPTYRDAEPTQSVLTITSNVVYGKNTGNTPGRPARRRAVRARAPTR